jgi:hypothetical protein
MKKFFCGFFMTLGVIFFILILVGTYLFVADPYNIKPLLFGSGTNTPVQNQQTTRTTQNTTNNTPAREQTLDKNPVLNQNQEAALEAVGIDPTNIPTQVSPEQELCFENTIGEARVAAIKAGGTPTALEIFAARNCL